ncbi:MAG: hypothetical protein IPN96_00225 [Anaerolineales bacterium]|nr:hypothetical protein [Anaerolineales bacterium]
MNSTVIYHRAGSTGRINPSKQENIKEQNTSPENESCPLKFITLIHRTDVNVRATPTKAALPPDGGFTE